MTAAPGRRLIANAPEGFDALLAGRLAREIAPRPLLFVLRDDARLSLLDEQIRFFHPETTVEAFPAWDCLPYDRVSPHRDILARRIGTLARLLEPAPTGRILLTTVNAFCQRVPPRAALAGRSLVVGRGGQLKPDRLFGFLAENGYLRSETVGEPGEYAVRGGIVDLFPALAEEPLRLDFFGDELESIRTFDPLTQRTTGKLDALVLGPVSEVILDPDGIERFRVGYRASFGRSGADDPLYEAVSAARHYPGMEHWLPLYYERLETLADYLAEPQLLLDHQAEPAYRARLESIRDFHESRRELAGTEGIGGSPYRPLPPEQLYLDQKAWDRLLARHPVSQLSPFSTPERAGQVLDAGGRRARDFSEARLASDSTLFDAVVAHLRAELAAGRRAAVACHTAGSLDRIAGVLGEHGLERRARIADWSEAAGQPADAVLLLVLSLDQGFGTDELTVVSEQDILGARLARPQRQRKRPESFLSEVATLGEGDLVVHVDHGIGRYEGLQALDVAGAPHDCLRVIYHGGDRLFVPVENIEVLSRFGSEDVGVELDRLGQGNWQARKARVKARLKDMAEALMKVAAARALQQVEPMQPAEGLYDEFCARFPYPETDDQLRAIEETLEDFGSGRPMDRLICGDVGFGKTEVALRAAFVAVMTGHQVAVVVPTTLLARQHFRTFQERFAGLPVRIAQLSRLIGAKDAAATRDGLENGTVDVVIGTHALLAKSIRFRELGLLIVDEEQHFGVRQKERLKQLREEVHVLTLTATPIPRTLQLSLSGVKEMSLIATPPVDRLAVRTFVLPYDPVVVREAIMREHYRGGQIFYVCPRIEDLDGVAARLRKLVPEIKLAMAHGRLSATALEAVMTGFVDHRYHLLLSTNIIESGLDIPSANTMIIHRADMFGLAQLYQLRGRIGRSKLRGYAYLTLPPGRVLTPTAEKRLHVMQTLDTLGAGFTLASHDLDIRGAGNLLGEEQSGHIREVGIELYQQLLEEAVAGARQGTAAGKAGPAEAAAGGWTPQIALGTSVLIPESYVADLNVRLGLYRRLSSLIDHGEIEAFAAELIDRFGALPEEVENLLQIMAIKRLCRDAGVDKIDAGPKGAVVSFHKDSFANPAGLIGFIQARREAVNLRPDHKLVFRHAWDGPKARLAGVRELLGGLAELARTSPAELA